jgi:hypothetical protein
LSESVFVIFDVENDQDLCERLVERCSTAGLGISVSGRSETFAWTDNWRRRAERDIRHADRVLVLCGERTEDCVSMASELRIAQQEQKPYLLLWGRREVMCTKPTGAKPNEGMYVWDVPTLQEQLALMRRVEQREVAASALKRHPGTPSGSHAPVG